MADSTGILRRLEALRTVFGSDAVARKLDLLRQLERRRLRSARAVLRFHECLCFMRAYPDNREVRGTVDRILEGFDRRSDLRRFRHELVDSGIAGTEIYYPLYWPTADWMARRWPARMTIDWEAFQRADTLVERLPYLLPYTESPTIDMLAFPARDWVKRLKGPDETDAAFLVRLFRGLPVDSAMKRILYEELDPMIRLEPGPDTPSRTRARYARSPLVFQNRPLNTNRPSLKEVIGEKPRSVTPVSRIQGQRLIDMAREAMITRSRDLDIFMHGDPADVRLVDFDDGLQFACIGTAPEKRLMLEAVYGFLTLKNGIPTGYVLASAFMQSSEIAYNVFETYRGGEAGPVFGKVMAMVHHLFGSTSFTLDPYQLGYGNMEGLQSGAWWFYYKMGFRPHHRPTRLLVQREREKMKRRRTYRSSIQTLEQLASRPVFYHMEGERSDVLGRMDLGAIGLSVTRYLARRFGGDRKRGMRACSRETQRLLGVRSLARFSRGERLAWERWSPLVLALPGVSGWTPVQKRDLVRVIRAKGGLRETEFVRRFDGHRRLRNAVFRLSRTRR